MPCSLAVGFKRVIDHLPKGKVVRLSLLLPTG